MNVTHAVESDHVVSKIDFKKELHAFFGMLDSSFEHWMLQYTMLSTHPSKKVSCLGTFKRRIALIRSFGPVP